MVSLSVETPMRGYHIMIHPCLQPFHPSSKKATGLPSTMVKAENIRCLQYLLFFLRFDFVNVFLFSKSSTGDIANKFGRRRGNEFNKRNIICLPRPWWSNVDLRSLSQYHAETATTTKTIDMATKGHGILISFD